MLSFYFRKAVWAVFTEDNPTTGDVDSPFFFAQRYLRCKVKNKNDDDDDVYDDDELAATLAWKTHYINPTPMYFNKAEGCYKYCVCAQCVLFSQARVSQAGVQGPQRVREH